MLTLSIHSIVVRGLGKVIRILEISEADSRIGSASTVRERDGTGRDAF